MLERIYIESYRTLRKTSVDFREGLNVIIGKNGVGKSNLMGFIANSAGIWLYIQGVSTITTPVSNYSYKLKRLNSDSNELTLEIAVEKIKPLSTEEHAERPFRIQVTRTIGSDTLSTPDYYTTTNDIRRKLQDGFLSLGSFQGTYVQFSLPKTLPYLQNAAGMSVSKGETPVFNRERVRLSFLHSFEFILEFSDSSDNGLDDLGILKETLLEAFEESITNVNLNEHLNNFTNIQQVRLSPNINIYKTDTGAVVENLVLEFMVDDSWMPWSYLSDGTKRSFQIIAEVVAAKNELVLIEEPEIGLHPTQLFKIMTFLKEQAQEKQIIISTHSPEVLNVLEPDELDNILIATIEKGRTSFHRLSEQKKAKAKTYMTEVGDLSSYWLHSDMEDAEEEEAAHD